MRRVNASILNAAAYRFVPLTDTAELREQLLAATLAAGLRGTILLAEEGINLYLAGDPATLRRFIGDLQSDPRFADLPVKYSECDGMPFKRMLVKVKREIIRMNMPAVRPIAGRAPTVDAKTLARWLRAGRCDEGRPVVLLDTRNGFEVDAGVFDGAVDWRLTKFSDFPAALQAHRAEFDGKTVVSYCTGGIRCEKAALVMQQSGMAHVHQLDGGILNYFLQTDGAPGWRGHCFVFDDRVALDPALHPSGSSC
jgi:UPF0176 protein